MKALLFFSAVLFGGHVRLVFTLVLGLFVACVIVTLTSFSEIPLHVLESSQVNCFSINFPTRPGRFKLSFLTRERSIFCFLPARACSSRVYILLFVVVVVVVVVDALLNYCPASSLLRISSWLHGE
jgi:hypothetical protein